ncbi:M23 family metallopeptidase [Paenibacillus methanolicus]|uniref:Stage IV sporulation protein FA n=1 Tax=Paenibacillus methanolicus TaxID=582686 RepID=A0A5S5C3Y2_9BACL|nr:M23 family metallopeptidase [Paenibacillus methanolicus]TYP73849.1 stage IV sporulation protein FA [Paenibacillus methanolicus]
MDTRNGVKQRRQERIRRIMEQEALEARPTQHDEIASSPFDSLPEAAWSGKTSSAAGEKTSQANLDPELAWKKRPNPWESEPSWGSFSALKPARGGAEAQPPASGGGSGPLMRAFFIQSMMAGVLFAIIFAMSQSDHPAAQRGKAIVTAALTDTIDFQGAASWYERTFAGAPSFIPIFRAKDGGAVQYTEGAIQLPVVAPITGGTIVQSFAQTLSGIDIAVKDGGNVIASETGRVSLVTDNGENGKTVVIQHANGRETIYGKLAEAQVAESDWVEAGQDIGTLRAASDDGTTLLFFAVKEKGRYVDPVDVVPFD